MKTLILGLGNPILTDDGVGIHVVRRLAEQAQDGITYSEASVGGLRLIETLAGFQRIIIVDAILSPGASPGHISRLGPGDLQASLHADSSHDLTLPAALELGRRLQMDLPDNENIVIIAIQAQDVLTFSEECTPEVAAAIDRAAQVVLDELDGGQPRVTQT